MSAVLLRYLPNLFQSICSVIQAGSIDNPLVRKHKHSPYSYYTTFFNISTEGFVRSAVHCMSQTYASNCAAKLTAV